MSNVLKTFVSYKTVQLFCSDIVVQNVNVISSPACKVLCFKKHHYHHHHHHHYHLIIITIIIKSAVIIIITIIIIITLSFIFNFFDIISSCVTFVFEFLCVFLTTCFLLFIGFRCNILLTNTFNDLLLLALVFLKNFSTFNKQFSKFIMCYDFNCKLVLDLYILFQCFRTVFITGKLGFNFKYQLHCIVECVIIITLNRFLNLK